MNQKEPKFAVNDRIRVRLAPSPTGWFHLGNARTALYNYLFAKKHKGKFILRIEDTDKARSEGKYEKDLIEGLLWLGLRWDEGPGKKGRFGPYRQSERTPIYKKYLAKMIEEGSAFYCFHTQGELAKEREKLKREKKPLVHKCSFRNFPLKEAEKLKVKKSFIIRFKTPENQAITFNDLIRGRISFKTNTLGDFSIAREIDKPLYNFSAAIDDWEMKISHVIRGEDHISNTPKQILIHRALQMNSPQYAHIPLIFGPDKKKLSKRHGKTALRDYRHLGYLPEALINFLAFLGWNPGDEREIFSLKELEKEFSLERIRKSAAIFDIKRLNFLNGYYIRKLTSKNFTLRCIPFLEKANLIKKTGKDFEVQTWKETISFEKLSSICQLEKKRLNRLCDIASVLQFIFCKQPNFPKELLIWKKTTDKQTLKNLQELLRSLLALKEEEFQERILRKKIETTIGQREKGQFLWPLRVALSGRRASPGPFEIMAVLGRKKTLSRIKYAINLLK